ncbi:MAG TPA: hypothetical protein VM260_10585, partial [Pirellula sp.]|nr:hypothetical protein [Pirellula sp.]
MTATTPSNLPRCLDDGYNSGIIFRQLRIVVDGRFSLFALTLSTKIEPNQTMHIQNTIRHVSIVALISIVFGCGPNASQTARPLTNVPADPVATVPVEEGAAPKSSDAPNQVQPSNNAEQAPVSSDAVAEAVNVSTPSVAPAQAIPPVAPKPIIVQPTAEQL